MKQVYFDNAATSYPKPPEVIRAVEKSFRLVGNPGRSSHKLAQRSSEIIYDCRKSVADLFSANANNVVFTMNATQSLNYAIKGLIKSGEHVLIDCFAHNASYRPLMELVNRGICTADIFDSQNPNEFESMINSKTGTVILTHQSNISSDVAELSVISNICTSHGLRLIVDASQSAGHIPINMTDTKITVLCMPGHKGLFSPMGVGILIASDDATFSTIIEGGAGINSLDIGMPDSLPERLEAGTLPFSAIAGLSGGIDYINHIGVNAITKRVTSLSNYIYRQLSNIDNVVTYGDCSGSVISFNIIGISPSDLGNELADYGICTRTGYHCAPIAHKALGSYENGSVRLSFSYMNTKHEADIFLNSLEKIIKKYKNA